ncbi:hypothetical protein ACFPVY_09875 [Flavobacterium qiangtangense]|uniref:TonB-dependent receptor plug domain-containing protein n=1 Tax=Flavobacterium qiangtangense TaxID=1442595 RepID=A0ABW1PMU2_9FLAO
MKFNSYKPNLFCLFLLLSSFCTYSQEISDQEDSEITKHISSYFSLDRENIHIQFPKKIFFTNEKIFFKGFVYNIKTGIPSVMTTNIYATLYNEQGEKVTEKLFYSSNGSFTSDFDLNNSFSTGKYYIHFFTNWMKNFKEDESSINSIQIINKDDKSYSKEIIPDFSSVSIKFNPEGGTLLENQKNIVGIKISDCNGNPFQISEGDLIDDKNIVLQKIHLNNFGFGKFEFVPNKKIYKVRFLINGTSYEEMLPIASAEGFALDANSFSVKDKTLLKIRTNLKTIEKYRNNSLKIVINQFDKIALLDLNFINDQEEQTILFENENISDGINTIRIIDSNLNVLAERMIFKHQKEKLEVDLQATKKASDSISFSGNLNLKYSDISISILPEESLSIDNENDIYGSFLLNSFLLEKSKNSRYYFNEITTKKKYELDLLLLNQSKFKYDWKDIITSAPKETFEFDNGLTLKGTVNQKISDPKKAQIIVTSPTSANFGNIDEKNEFFFNNLILTDSTKVNITFINERSKSVEFKDYPQVLNSRRTFNKSIRFKNSLCEIQKQKVEIDFPQFKLKTIMLDSVKIVGATKPTLNYETRFGNSRLRGFKIAENEGSAMLLQFIRMNGFTTENENTSLRILSDRNFGTFRTGKSSPAIYMDDIPVAILDVLQQITMREVDEIYLDTNMRSSAFPDNIGVIKIYMKKGARNSSYKNNITTYPIPKGFSAIKPFKNVSYNSTSDLGFKNFGLINWIPNIIANENGHFAFQIPNMNQKKVKILIEGFSADGKLISEIKTIELE